MQVVKRLFRPANPSVSREVVRQIDEVIRQMERAGNERRLVMAKLKKEVEEKNGRK